MTGATVALVGAGPGAVELLTLRAEALLAVADHVVSDGGLVALARQLTSAEVTIVAEGPPAVPELLAATARADRLVVRLYRGDPWLHPAHAAERAALEQASVPTEAVPGVAVEVAVPALAGVPVHVRHLAVACTVGPFDVLPPATDPARTMVASGDDPEAMVRAVAAAGDGGLPSALISVADPVAPWRGQLADAAEPAASWPGPALFVVGAVCDSTPQPGSPVAGVAVVGPDPDSATARPLERERS